MKPLTQAEARQYSPMALAFLGDSVYEVMVREYLLRAANQPAAKLHDQKVQLVCAGFQAAAADRLLPVLTENETGVGEIFPGDGVAPDAERKACIPRFLRAQPKPGCFKWCKIHCGSSFVFSSIDKNMVS